MPAAHQGRQYGRLAPRPEGRCRYTDAPEGPGLSLAVVGMLPEGENRVRRTHWSRRHRAAHNIDLLLVSAWRGPLPSLRPPVRVAYRRWSFGRPADWDNVIASSKDVLDAIVRLRVIPDDSPRVIPVCPQYFQAQVESPELQGFELAIAEDGAALTAVDLLAWASLFRRGRELTA